MTSSPPSPGPRAASARRDFVAVLLLGLLGTAAGLLVAWNTDERWLVSAKVLLQIGPETAGTRPSMVGSPAPFLAGNPRREDVQTEVELLSNTELLRRAFERLRAADEAAALGPEGGRMSALLRTVPESLGLVAARSRADRALDKWASSLRIAVVPSSTVLLVECRTAQPEAAVAMLEHLLALYLEDHRAAFGGRGMSPVLAGLVADREKSLAAAETRLTALRGEHQLVDPVEETNQEILTRTAAETRARELRALLDGANARLGALTRLLGETPAELRAQSEQGPNPLHDDLEMRLATARQDLVTAQQQFNDDAVEVRRAREMVGQLEALVAATTARREAAVTSGRNPLHDTLLDLVAKTGGEVAATTAELASTNAALQQIAADLQRIERARAPLQKAEQDVLEAKKDLTQAHEGLRLAHVEHLLDEHQVANVTVVAKPGYLPTPMRSFGLPARLAIVLGGLLAGVALAVAWILWRRGRQRDAAARPGPAR